MSGKRVAGILGLCLSLVSCGHGRSSALEGSRQPAQPSNSVQEVARPPAGDRWCPESWIPGGDQFHNSLLGEDPMLHGPPAKEQPWPWIAAPRLDSEAKRLELALPSPESDKIRWISHGVGRGHLIREREIDLSGSVDDELKRWLDARPLGAGNSLLEKIEIPSEDTEREGQFEGGQRWTMTTDRAYDAHYELNPWVRLDIASRCSWFIVFSSIAFDPSDPSDASWRLSERSIWSDPRGQLLVAVATYHRDNADDPMRSYTTSYTVLGILQ